MGAHAAPEGDLLPIPDDVKARLSLAIDGLRDTLDDLAAEAFPMPKSALGTPAEDDHIDLAYGTLYAAAIRLLEGRAL